MDELVQWLGEQLDEDERIARAAEAAYGSVWTADEQLESVSSDTGADVVEEPNAPHAYIAEHDPARVLREIDAARGLLNAYVAAQEVVDAVGHPDMYDVGRAQGLEEAVRFRALAYAGRPGYREEWRP